VTSVVSTAGDRPGLYPSCSRALARRRPNTNDANGYYEFLGLFPWASPDEIRAAARAGFKRWHPDGSQPDEAKFIRLKEIAGTLLDPDAKAAYDSVPNDGLWIDSQTREALAGALEAQLEVAIEEALPVPAPAAEGWDWFSDYLRDGDGELASGWYDHLVDAAPLAGYTRTIKVMLTDDPAPRWMQRAGIVAVPRTWRPNRSTAWALFSAVIR